MWPAILSALSLLLVGQAADPLRTRESATSAPSTGRTGKVVPLLTTRGYDTIRIGMEPNEIKGYTPIGLPKEHEDCYTFRVREVPDLLMLVTEGVVKRVSIGQNGNSGIRAERGIGIGSSEAAVKKAFPSAKHRPHQYADAPASYYTWLPGGGMQGLRFETGSDRRVIGIYAGLMPPLGFVEDCS